MNSSLWVIAGAAASLGFVHTLIGPDHYLPFIVMSRARGWTLARTLVIAFVCGLGHVLSSIVLGLAGVALGVAVFKLESIESFRGGVAAWLLIGFGFAYFLWGLRRALRRRQHQHAHVHEDGGEHEHAHGHDAPHAHVHGRAGKTNITPWVLFTIFVLGPCEPLIPLVMIPAARHNFGGVVFVAGVFGAVTIMTMLALVAAASWGAKFIRLGRLEPYVHALAGAMIFLSGVSVQILGL